MLSLQDLACEAHKIYNQMEDNRYGSSMNLRNKKAPKLAALLEHASTSELEQAILALKKDPEIYSGTGSRLQNISEILVVCAELSLGQKNPSTAKNELNELALKFNESFPNTTLIDHAKDYLIDYAVTAIERLRNLNDILIKQKSPSLFKTSTPINSQPDKNLDISTTLKVK